MKHPFRRAAQGILCAAVLALVVSLFCSSAMLTITHQTVPAPVDAGLRIAHLTDLHNACFGKDNARLVQAVREQQPDLIFCTGDLFNKNDPDTTRAGALVKQLTEIAPVYCSLGNHEVEWGKNFGADPAEVYRQAGAIVVEREFFDVTVQGSDLRIGGLYGYACPQGGEREKEWSAHAWYAEECAFLRTFCDTPRTKLLLCHMPVAWLEYGGLDSWTADVVFAGHAHGGQVRLPFAGALYAPDQGWFPGRMCGLYSSADGLRTLELSRGLGGAGMLGPRLNNPPELVIVDLVPRSGG